VSAPAGHPGIDPADRVRCALALGGGDAVPATEALRLCREAADGAVPAISPAALYARLLEQEDLVPVETPFGDRLAVTPDLTRRAEAVLRRTAPPRLPAPRPLPAPAPSLLHDLVTLAGFVARETPRVTGRGLLGAPALRRLEGLALTDETTVPAVDRRALEGSRVWHFLLRFLTAQGGVSMAAGRARVDDALLDALAGEPGEWAAALFTFGAARRAVLETAWLAALAGPVPATFDARRVEAWLAAVAAPGAPAPTAPSLAFLEALGFARWLDGRRFALLAGCARLWGDSPNDAPGQAGPALELPGGGVAVDLAEGAGALAARAPFERRSGPQAIGHVAVYAAAAEAPPVPSAAPAACAAGLGGILTGPDASLLAAVADALGPRAVGRWPGGIAVEPFALEEAIERLQALGAAVERRLPGSAPAAQATAAGPARAAALPWTLSRCRAGVWAADESERPGAAWRMPTGLGPDEAAALPALSARLRAAARLGLLVEVVQGAQRRAALPIDVVWRDGGEEAVLIWADAADGAVVQLPLRTVEDAIVARTAARAADPGSLTVPTSAE